MRRKILHRLGLVVIGANQDAVLGPLDAIETVVSTLKDGSIPGTICQQVAGLSGSWDADQYL